LTPGESFRGVCHRRAAGRQLFPYQVSVKPLPLSGPASASSAELFLLVIWIDVGDRAEIDSSLSAAVLTVALVKVTEPKSASEVSVTSAGFEQSPEHSSGRSAIHSAEFWSSPDSAWVKTKFQPAVRSEI